MEFTIDCSEQLMAEATAFPKEKMIQPRRSVADMIANVENLAPYAEEDKDKFAAVNFDVSIIPKLKPLAVAVLSAQANWTRSDQDQTSHAYRSKTLYAELKIEHTDRLGILTYATRDNEKAQEDLKDIRRGAGRSDLINDMFDMLKVATSNLDALIAINEDLTKFESSYAKAKELMELIGSSNKDAEMSSENKELRDRFYSLLASYTYEVSEVGKFVHRNDPDRKEHYNFNA